MNIHMIDVSTRLFFSKRKGGQMQVLDIQSFCQHLPMVELSYSVEAALNRRL
jgi:hypothetical protein